jgi:hypothetical protein
MCNVLRRWICSAAVPVAPVFGMLADVAMLGHLMARGRRAPVMTRNHAPQFNQHDNMRQSWLWNSMQWQQESLMAHSTPAVLCRNTITIIVMPFEVGVSDTIVPFPLLMVALA